MVQVDLKSLLIFDVFPINKFHVQSSTNGGITLLGTIQLQELSLQQDWMGLSVTDRLQMHLQLLGLLYPDNIQKSHIQYIWLQSIFLLPSTSEGGGDAHELTITSTVVINCRSTTILIWHALDSNCLWPSSTSRRSLVHTDHSVELIGDLIKAPAAERRTNG